MEKFRQIIIFATQRYLDFVRSNISDFGVITSQQDAKINDLLMLAQDEGADFSSLKGKLIETMESHKIQGTRLEPFLNVVMEYLTVSHNPEYLPLALMKIDGILISLRQHEGVDLSDDLSLSSEEKLLSTHLSLFVGHVKKELNVYKIGKNAHRENDLSRRIEALEKENKTLSNEITENRDVIQQLEALVGSQHRQNVESLKALEAPEVSFKPFGDTGFLIHVDHIGRFDEAYYKKLMELISNDQKYDMLFSESQCIMSACVEALRDNGGSLKAEPNPYLAKVMAIIENVYERLTSIYQPIYRTDIKILDKYERAQMREYFENTLLHDCQGLLTRLNSYSAGHQKTKVLLQNKVSELMENEDVASLRCLGNLYERTALIEKFYMGSLTFARASIERIESFIDPKRSYGGQTTIEYFTAFRMTGAVNYEVCLRKIAEDEIKMREYAQRAARLSADLRKEETAAREGSSEPSESEELSFASSDASFERPSVKHGDPVLRSEC